MTKQYVFLLWRKLTPHRIIAICCFLLSIILQPQYCVAQNWIPKGLPIEGDTNSRAGWAIGLSSDGKTLAAGSPQYSSPTLGASVGKVTVFEWKDSAWVQKGQEIFGSGPYSFWGTSLALAGDGNTIVVGKPGSCSVYSWSVPDSSWTLINTFSGNGGSGLGSSLSINADGSVFAYGSYNVGVHVLELNGNNYQPMGNSITDTTNGSPALTTVSLNYAGDILAVGTPNGNSNGPNSGRVRIFQWNNTSNEWTQTGSTIVGSTAHGELGVSVSLNGDGTVVAMGAPNPYIAGVDSSSGYVRVFDFANNDWVQELSDIQGNQNRDEFGSSVSLDQGGNILIVGAPGDNSVNNSSGRVSVLNTNGLSWSPRGSAITGNSSNEYSGYDVAISSNALTMAFGSPGKNNTSGEIKSFSWDSGTSSGFQKSSGFLTFSLFPNPTDGIIHLQFERVISKTGIEIFNSTGKIVFKTAINNKSKAELALNLPNGIYVLRADDNHRNEGARVFQIMK